MTLLFRKVDLTAWPRGAGRSRRGLEAGRRREAEARAGGTVVRPPGIGLQPRNGASGQVGPGLGTAQLWTHGGGGSQEFQGRTFLRRNEEPWKSMS